MSSLMLEETGDVILQRKGDAMNAIVGPILKSTGWRGGQWVRYVPPTGVDDFVVEASDGNEATGFLIFPSEAYGRDEQFGAVNNFTSYVLRENGTTGAGTMAVMAGGGRMLFLVYETVALDGGGNRAGGPITYNLNEDLKISERGYLCNDSDVNLAAAGVTNPQIVGKCCMVPAARNRQRLGLDLKF